MLCICLTPNNKSLLLLSLLLSLLSNKTPLPYLRSQNNSPGPFKQLLSVIFIIIIWKAQMQCVMNDPLFFLLFRYSYHTLNPYRTSTSMLSLSSPTSLDLLYDSFYESFLFLAYDLFGLIACVMYHFR